MNLLEIKKVTKRFGGLTALSEVSFSVREKSILGLIGPNGSGKTTLFNIMTGFLKPDSGSVFLKGAEVTGLKPHELAHKGIYRTFQLTRVFGKLTVLENMLVTTGGQTEQLREKACQLLKYFNLFRIKDEQGGNLSFGQQKLLELARLLMHDPSVLLLDEPAAGVNPVLIQEMLTYLKDLQSQGKTLIIVEHKMPLIFGLCDEIVVLDHGVKVASGTAKDIQNNEKVIDAYLGSQL